jgi:hypothetical protein
MVVAVDVICPRLSHGPLLHGSGDVQDLPLLYFRVFVILLEHLLVGRIVDVKGVLLPLGLLGLRDVCLRQGTVFSLKNGVLAGEIT